jgi:hypothetical protein
MLFYHILQRKPVTPSSKGTKKNLSASNTLGFSESDLRKPGALAGGFLSTFGAVYG